MFDALRCGFANKDAAAKTLAAKEFEENNKRAASFKALVLAGGAKKGK